MASYRCPGCGYVYDEANGAAREGFPPGTAWDHVPDDWCCPDCAVREKVDFEKMDPTTMRADTARGVGQSTEVTQ